MSRPQDRPDSRSMNLVAAELSRLTICPGKIRADSYRLLRIRVQRAKFRFGICDGAITRGRRSQIEAE